MNAPQHGDPWPGHARMAVRLGQGFTSDGRASGQTLVLITTALAVALFGFIPGPLTHALLTAALAFPAVFISAKSTSAAAQGLYALWLAPSAASQQWLRGWWQLQTMRLPWFAVCGSLIVVSSGRAISSALFTFGVVLCAQGLGAWGALTAHGQSRQSRWLLPLLFSVGLSLGLTKFADHFHSISPWFGWALIGGSAALLWVANRSLQGMATKHGHLAEQHAPVAKASSALRTFFEGFQPLESSGRRYGMWRVFLPTLNPLLLVLVNLPVRRASEWHATFGPTKALLFILLTPLLTTALVQRPISWREWLMPGSLQRHRLGQRMLASTLLVQAITLAALAPCLMAAVWLLSDESTTSVILAALRSWPLVIEWAAATALGVVWIGLYLTRRRVAWSCVLAVLAVLSWILWTFIGSGQGDLPTWGTVNEAYVIGLLILVACLVPVANVVWARADLHLLMNGARAEPKTGWET